MQNTIDYLKVQKFIWAFLMSEFVNNGFRSIGKVYNLESEKMKINQLNKLVYCASYIL